LISNKEKGINIDMAYNESINNPNIKNKFGIKNIDTFVLKYLKIIINAIRIDKNINQGIKSRLILFSKQELIFHLSIV
jgi:hypothetical protein